MRFSKPSPSETVHCLLALHHWHFVMIAKCTSRCRWHCKVAHLPLMPRSACCLSLSPAGACSHLSAPQHALFVCCLQALETQCADLENQRKAVETERSNLRDARRSGTAAGGLAAAAPLLGNLPLASFGLPASLLAGLNQQIQQGLQPAAGGAAGAAPGGTAPGVP